MLFCPVGSQLWRGIMNSLNQLAKLFFLAFLWCPLLHKIKVILKSVFKFKCQKINFHQPVCNFQYSPRKAEFHGRKNYKNPPNIHFCWVGVLCFFYYGTQPCRGTIKSLNWVSKLIFWSLCETHSKSLSQVL